MWDMERNRFGGSDAEMQCPDLKAETRPTTATDGPGHTRRTSHPSFLLVVCPFPQIRSTSRPPSARPETMAIARKRSRPQTKSTLAARRRLGKTLWSVSSTLSPSSTSPIHPRRRRILAHLRPGSRVLKLSCRRLRTHGKTKRDLL
jgi:hypothetical protein